MGVSKAILLTAKNGLPTRLPHVEAKQNYFYQK